MITAAITAVGGGVGQAVLRALQYSHLPIKTIGFDAKPMSAGLYWVDKAFLVPPALDEEAYIKTLLEICSSNSIDVLIPSSDPELYPLAKNQGLFLQIGCKVIVGSPECISLCQDKRVLADLCLQLGLPFVITYTVEEALQKIPELNFPLIVKPRIGSGSVGARLIYHPEDLLRISPDSDLVIQPYLRPKNFCSVPVSSATWAGRLEQTDEISAQFFVDETGHVLGSFISTNCLKDGVVMEVVPTSIAEVEKEGLHFVQLLAKEGLRGPINLQGRLTEERIRFFEVNPRFTGLTGVRAAMGYREVEAAIRLFVLQQNEEARHCLEWTPGFVATRHVEETLVENKRIVLVSAKKQSARQDPEAIAECVLVTGASGYVGANVIGSLLARPEIKEVRAAVRSDKAEDELKSLFGGSSRLSIVRGELPVSPWPLDGVRVVIHLAGLREPFMQSASGEEFFSINAEGTRRLLDQIRVSGVKRMIYLSTQAVYGTKSLPPWTEMHQPCPDTPYGLSKWIAELLCLNANPGAVQSLVLRSARIYGLGHLMRWEELPHKFASLTASGKALPLHSDGKESLDLVHIKDVCRSIVTACSIPLSDSSSGVFNIGSGRPVAVAHIASACRQIAKDLGLPIPPIKKTRAGKSPIRQFGMDIRRAKSLLGWAPSISLEDGLRELIKSAAESNQRKPGERQNRC